mmetsp:Transcript_3492/g.4200  ORF Transcript_3492/g.4200 Transcript_3492/m.4200 type:complete len:85 (+) Transcript_3492:683-937(+)
MWVRSTISLSVLFQLQFLFLRCETAYVKEIVEELKARQYHRGDAAKMRIAERQIEILKRIEAKVDHLIANSYKPLPPELEAMKR